MKLTSATVSTLTIIAICTPTVFTQKKPVPDYKLTGMKIVRFDESTGKFGDNEIGPDEWFGNDLSMSLFATIEISGPPGEYVSTRRLSITAIEGKRIKLRKMADPGVLSASGKYYVPVWLYGSMCEPVKLTATITGQRTRATMSRKVNFHCGE